MGTYDALAIPAALVPFAAILPKFPSGMVLTLDT